MYWLLSFSGAVLVAVILSFVISVNVGRGEKLEPVTQGKAYQEHWRYLRHSSINEESVSRVKFSLAVRGYNPREVDAYLERVADRIGQLEQQLHDIQTIHKEEK